MPTADSALDINSSKRTLTPLTLPARPTNYFSIDINARAKGVIAKFKIKQNGFLCHNRTVISLSL